MEVAENRITFLSKNNCHLCKEAQLILDQLCAELKLNYTEVDIYQHPDLLAAWQELIPVVLIDGVQQSQWFIDTAELKPKLQALTKGEA